MKIVTVNKKAFFDYEFSEVLEAGIVLTGDEVKSIRNHGINLTGSFITIHNGELFMINCHIKPYGHAYLKDEADASRRRKLLLHKYQVLRFIGLIAQRSVVLLPLKVYFSDKNKVKIDIGVGKHKKLIDKKAILKERDISREIRRTIKTAKIDK